MRAGRSRHVIRRSGAPIVLAVLLLAAPPFASARVAAPAAAPALTTYALPTKEQLDGLAAALPKDSSVAAAELIKRIYGASEEDARVAVAEALRRAGIPIVATDGPIVGMPDGYVLNDAAVYVDFTREIARSLRRGDAYTGKDLEAFLADVGVLTRDVDAKYIVAALGQWGKAKGAPAETDRAGTLIRALSGRRGDVLWDGADPVATRIDVLQLIIVVAQLTSRTWEHQRTASLSGLTASADFVAADGFCDWLADPLKSGLGKASKDVLKESVKEYIKGKLPKSQGGAVSTASDVWDKGTSALSVLLMYLGTTLELTADKTATHFKHSGGERQKHVLLEAVANFDSTIAAKQVGCYKLAGIDVPKPGPIKSNIFRIRWRLDQKVGSYPNANGVYSTFQSGKYLAVTHADSKKVDSCGTCGETLEKGKSTLELYPPVEKKPGEGAEMFGKVKVTAALDKDVDITKLFKVTDPYSLVYKSVDKPNNPYVWAVKKLIDLGLLALSRASLPNAYQTIRVGYHGKDVYQVKGSTWFWMFYIEMPVDLDIYTCAGLRNAEWKGKGGIPKYDVTFFGDIAGRIAGQEIPRNLSAYNNHISQKVDALGDLGFDFIDIVDPLQGMMTITRPPKEEFVEGGGGTKLTAEHVDGPVGDLEIYIADQSMDALGAALGLWSAKFQVVGVDDKEGRCPGGGKGDYYYEDV